MGVSVQFDPQTHALALIPGVDKGSGSIAWATYDDKLAETGWGTLWVGTNEITSYSNDVKMYAAGVAEGLASAKRMSQFYSNVYQSAAMSADIAAAFQNLRHSFKRQFDYLMNNANLYKDTTSTEPVDPYWKHARYITLQMNGILDGYNTMAFHSGVRTLNMVDMLLLNAHGQLGELLQAYTPAAMAQRREYQAAPAFLQSEVDCNNTCGPDNVTAIEIDISQFGDLSPQGWEKKIQRDGHCSAYLKVEEKFERNFRVNGEMRDEILVYNPFLLKF